MTYEVTERGIEIIPKGKFDLKNTFECGQCFRWDQRNDDSYSGIVRGKFATLRSENEKVIIEGITEEDFHEIWEDYFDLNNDYDGIRNEISENCPRLSCAVGSIDGIRILSQEPWEALCSFIISQNNNIPRIKGIITRLCEGFGDKLDHGSTFPSAERLAELEPEDLSEIRAGFRARYIIDAAKKVSSGEIYLDEMYTAPISDCRTQLMRITGVGAKVAECTLLYGLHRLEAFPVDVWMKKALATHFSGVTIEQIGRYAGIAQQYIFHYSRLNPELVE